MGPVIGFVGLGNMGQPRAANLLKAGYRLRVWDRTPARAAALAAQGATAASRPEEVVEPGGLLISSLSNDHVLEDAEMPDLTRVDRAIRKEPAYVAKNPLYGLVLFGLKAEKRIWLVLDKSKPGASTYDVLHIDRNADGDLTGPGERIKAKGGVFKLGGFTDPATGAKHSEFTVRVSGAEPTVMLSLRWRGKLKFGGGYPEDPEAGYLRFAARPKDAPVVWVHGDAPFRF